MEEQQKELTEAKLPGNEILRNAVKISIAEDRPILLDYWAASLEKNCFIGVRENDEKLLVKNEDEYTSPINKIYQVENEYIITTENSLYIVSNTIASRRIA